MRYGEVFGEAFPKGKALVADGSCVTPAAGAREQLCFMQYAPRPDRIGWIYVTHGLSQACITGSRPSRLELALHWRERDNKAAVSILARAAQYMLDCACPIAAGAVLSSREVPGLSSMILQHWLACEPDPTIPAHLDIPLNPHSGKKGKGEVGRLRFVLLLGISDAELQCALKVNPALADGRTVLLEALQDGGVFPVSDPERTCLTRRSDFHRLWENAFRIVRERTANGNAG